MRILIEGHKYPADAVRDILRPIQPLKNVEGYIVPNCVGYCYNASTAIHDCVFILPKVLLQDKDKKEFVFGHATPESIIHLEENQLLVADDPNRLNDAEVRFIYELAVWIYRAIVVYSEGNNDSSIVYTQQGAPMGRGNKRQSNTFLDILLGLIRFNEDNQDFVFFTLRNIHSGYNKINWTRTISHSQAYIQENTPIYINPINKRKMINFDEELFIIYYSILDYISKAYGFPIRLEVQFPLLSESQFETYLEGFGATRLKQIRYKYFSDKALELWELCYAFFDRSTQVNVALECQDYLIASNFNIVFESIIDHLIGDREHIPNELMDQEDGKLVDHMYSYRSLTHKEDCQEEVYYIGDSKYYKMGNPIGRESVAKQFTYARNVIQWNMSLFLDGKSTEKDVRLRDDKLESYNVIPNFFISARLNEDLDYSDELMKSRKAKTIFTSEQFTGRLFDRDTLLISHYDVNFLYIISLYARNNELEISEWKEKVHEKFRKEIRAVLEDHYDFSCMVAKEGVNPEIFMREHFKDIIGRVFTPYPSLEGHEFFAYAEEDPSKLPNDTPNREEKMRLIQEGNDRARKILDTAFDIRRCSLGQDIRQEMLPTYAPTTGINGTIEDDYAILVMRTQYYDAIQKLTKADYFAFGIGLTEGALSLQPEIFKTHYVVVHNKQLSKVNMLKPNPKLCTKKQVGKEGDKVFIELQDSPMYIVYEIDHVTQPRFTQVTKVETLSHSNKKGAYDTRVVRVSELI